MWVNTLFSFGCQYFPFSYPEFSALNISLLNPFLLTSEYSVHKMFVPEAWQQRKSNIHIPRLTRLGKIMRNPLNQCADLSNRLQVSMIRWMIKSRLLCYILKSLKGIFHPYFAGCPLQVLQIISECARFLGCAFRLNFFGSTFDTGFCLLSEPQILHWY